MYFYTILNNSHFKIMDMQVLLAVRGENFHAIEQNPT